MLESLKTSHVSFYCHFNEIRVKRDVVKRSDASPKEFWARFFKKVICYSYWLLLQKSIFVTSKQFSQILGKLYINAGRQPSLKLKGIGADIA